MYISDKTVHMPLQFKDKKNLKADCKRDEPGIDTFGGTNDICCQVAKKKKIKYQFTNDAVSINKSQLLLP